MADEDGDELENEYEPTFQVNYKYGSDLWMIFCRAMDYTEFERVCKAIHEKLAFSTLQGEALLIHPLPGSVKKWLAIGRFLESKCQDYECFTYDVGKITGTVDATLKQAEFCKVLIEKCQSILDMYRGLTL